MSLADPITVVIVEDHTLVREGTRRILTSEPGLQVVGEAGRAAEALELCRRLQPDVALLDLRLPDGSGIRLAAELLEACPTSRSVILSAFDDEEYVVAALEAGAAGYLVKDIPSADLIDAVRRAHEGQTVLQPSLAAALTIRHLNPRPRLSTRELEVLTLVASGLPNKLIVRRLGISERTVENHVRHVFDKLGVASRTEAVVQAMTRRLLPGGWAEDWGE
jgi:DNA-binding NarL/FixJ family response regulator